MPIHHLIFIISLDVLILFICGLLLWQVMKLRTYLQSPSWTWTGIAVAALFSRSAADLVMICQWLADKDWTHQEVMFWLMLKTFLMVICVGALAISNHLLYKALLKVNRWSGLGSGQKNRS